MWGEDSLQFRQKHLAEFTAEDEESFISVESVLKRAQRINELARQAAEKNGIQKPEIPELARLATVGCFVTAREATVKESLSGLTIRRQGRETLRADAIEHAR